MKHSLYYSRVPTEAFYECLNRKECNVSNYFSAFYTQVFLDLRNGRICEMNTLKYRFKLLSHESIVSSQRDLSSQMARVVQHDIQAQLTWLAAPAVCSCCPGDASRLTSIPEHEMAFGNWEIILLLHQYNIIMSFSSVLFILEFIAISF